MCSCKTVVAKYSQIAPDLVKTLLKTNSMGAAIIKAIANTNNVQLFKAKCYIILLVGKEIKSNFPFTNR